MASRFETQMTKSYETKVCVELTCDLCGRAAPSPDDQGRYGRAPWTDESYDVDTVLILRESGSNYPEGSSTETESFDVCPDCWKTKVVPWFKSWGATPTIRDND